MSRTAFYFVLLVIAVSMLACDGLNGALSAERRALIDAEQHQHVMEDEPTKVYFFDNGFHTLACEIPLQKQAPFEVQCITVQDQTLR